MNRRADSPLKAGVNSATNERCPEIGGVGWRSADIRGGADPTSLDGVDQLPILTRNVSEGPPYRCLVENGPSLTRRVMIESTDRYASRYKKRTTL